MNTSACAGLDVSVGRRVPSAYCWSCTSFAPERAFPVMMTAETKEVEESVECEVEKSVRDVGEVAVRADQGVHRDGDGRALQGR